MSNLFVDELEQTAIVRIQKFAKIAEAYGYEVALGFSGGKDSQVCYDLCKRAGIEFKAYYNVAFESATTKRFIRDNYPDVIWRRDHKYGFIENIAKNHNGLLPTVEIAYCCKDYKHNPKYVEKCSIVGVRKQESAKRANRTAVSFKNKTTKKKMQQQASEYFVENCQSVGTASVIQLSPYLSNMHNVIEGRITYNPVQYLLNNNGKFFKYVTVYEDSKYRVVLVKDKKSVEGYVEECKKLLLKHETFIKEHGDPYGWRTRTIDFLKKEIELIENGNTTTQAIIIQ